MTFRSFISCLLLMILYGCNELDPKGEKELRAFVNAWNESHTQLKAAYLIPSYMDVVTYYGKKRTKIQVQQDKNLLFQEFPDYTQDILNDQLTITKEAGIYLVTFTKHVNYNGIEAEYPSYLSVTVKNGTFKILREGVTEDAKDLDAPIFPSARENNLLITNNRQLFGDFNGDGLSDYASVLSPEISATTDTETQSSIIIFSNADLEPITIQGAYKSQLENLKDLNSDGADEIGFWDIKPNTKTLLCI